MKVPKELSDAEAKKAIGSQEETEQEVEGVVKEEVEEERKESNKDEILSGNTEAEWGEEILIRKSKKALLALRYEATKRGICDNEGYVSLEDIAKLGVKVSSNEAEMLCKGMGGEHRSGKVRFEGKIEGEKGREVAKLRLNPEVEGRREARLVSKGSKGKSKGNDAAWTKGKKENEMMVKLVPGVSF